MKKLLSSLSPQAEAIFQTVSLLVFSVALGTASALFLTYALETFGVQALISAAMIGLVGFMLWLVYSVNLDRIKMERKLDEINAKYDQK